MLVWSRRAVRESLHTQKSCQELEQPAGTDFGPNLRLLYSLEHYTYTYTCRNIFNTIRTNKGTSLEKYTSHFIWKGSKGLLKVLLCERWVGDWTELQHIDPHSYGHNSVSFPFSWAAQPGAWGLSLSGTWSSFQHLLSNWSEALNSNCNSSVGGLRAPSAGCWFSLEHLISN